MKKKTADDLYAEIVSYTPTKTEQARHDEWQSDIKNIYKQIDSLEHQGQDLLRNVSIGDQVAGNYKNAPQVKAIQDELHKLRIKTTSFHNVPIFDDEYHAICEELEAVTSQREETEGHYNKALTEYSKAGGQVPFDMYKQLEQECYSLSGKLEELKEKECELQMQKVNYVRKTDSLLAEYQKTKDAEIKEVVRETVYSLIETVNAAKAEKNMAELITAGRKGQQSPVVSIPFGGGDIYSHIIASLNQILNIVGK